MECKTITTLEVDIVHLSVRVLSFKILAEVIMLAACKTSLVKQWWYLSISD